MLVTDTCLHFGPDWHPRAARRIARLDFSRAMIDHDKKLIFIHLPKCGGTSIEYALTGTGWHIRGLRDQQHLTAEETLRLYGEKVFVTYFKFAVVRNTWDLLVAYYLWGCSGLKGMAPKSWRVGRAWGHPFDNRRKWLSRKPTFREYLSDIPGLNAQLRLSLTGRDLTRQLQALSIDGRIAVDYVAHFDNISSEFTQICDLCGIPPSVLPHKLKSDRKKHYSEFYEPDLTERVRRQYSDDIEAFGFHWDVPACSDSRSV